MFPEKQKNNKYVSGNGQEWGGGDISPIIF